MADSQNQTKVLLNDAAIALLRRALGSPKTRAVAVRDPRRFLEQHGIELPKGASIAIYERASAAPRRGGRGRRKGNEPRDQIYDWAGGAYLPEGASALAQWWWASTHMGCPLGTYPYTTIRKQQVCDSWAIAVGSTEWVSDRPGTAFGHWEFQNVQRVCVASHEEIVEVIECLPRLLAP